MNDRLAPETPRTVDGLVWAGAVIASFPLRHTGPAPEGVDLLDSEILDSPWDDLSGGTTHVSGHVLVVPRNSAHFRRL